MSARPHQRWWGSPTHLWDRLSAWCVGWAGKLWIDITSVVWQLATHCLILGVVFRGHAIQWRHCRDRWSKGRCHGNQFWDYISCKWTLMGTNDTRLSYKGRFVFSQRLSVGCSVWIRTWGGWNCSWRATVRLEIDTLIANILVRHLFAGLPVWIPNMR